MAKQVINQGTAPTGAGGDTFRTGSAKLQANDNELYNYLGDGTNLNKLGTAAFKNTGTQAGNVMGVGAFGLGGNAIQNSFNGEAGGSFLCNASAIDQFLGRYSAGVNIPYVSQSFGFQIGVIDLDTSPSVVYRFKKDNSYTAVQKLYGQYNTTVDSNGFIKAASPIVKLFSEKIELNDEAQKQEIVFEKLGTGNYLIKGSTGFAQEGWYIETPKDANGNVLFSVIYKTLENGDISVKTYKKKFDFETVSIVTDLENPIDITENRWIDLRLQELPQPEIEIPEPIAPPDFQPTGLAEAVATVMESYNDTEQ
ncbi:phage tail protein [Acinetobacter sp. CS-2]|uniref:phage tail fiber protein n=1 Tax=Acinetobacter sp. CS-2 TaxID=2798861 RepID=UPI0019083E78|nr:phage tail protein [Acinetobacter sp. CS-2]QQN40561.1 phage tail protein [Acinetobacter sp. CS-2]